MEEIKRKIKDLREGLEILKKKLEVARKLQEIKKLEEESGRSDFWHDQRDAQVKIKLLSFYRAELEELDRLEKRLIFLEEISCSDESALLLEDLRSELDELTKELTKLETRVYLGGKYDHCSAIVSIHAGQGGVEAMDWAQMLQRMYLRFAEKKGWKVDVVNLVPGDEAGVKSVTLTINGSYAYGYLKKEKGVHRLVRQSPFNADKLRQTSFALVEILPEIEESEEIRIPEEDLEWEFFRASSHGGQNVQKVSTAVRLRHKPTGIVITSQSERYQERNREIALNLLRARLWELAEEKREKEKAVLKGDFKKAAWGNQIRSYVLHPYKMVKDLRTNYEVSDPFAVLDGEIEGFIAAELKSIS